MREKLLAQARGEEKADLVFKGGLVADVFSGRWVHESVAVSGGIILGRGGYEGIEEVDLNGKILVPGFFDGHLHLESSLVTVGEFARQVISRGTTTIFPDPHEIANVAGEEGIRFMLEEGKKYPWNFNLLLPSCVPASPFETPGAVLEKENLEKFKNRAGVFGLGEVMNYPGVISGDQNIWAKIKAFSDSFIDGHSPGLSGMNLNAYLLAGIAADHEITSAEEALEKIAAGMFVMVREGSAARNLKELIKAVDEQNRERFIFATDDRHPEDILQEGHIDYILKLAVGEGLDPMTALRMATINSARAFGLKNLGAIAPGYKADLLVVEDYKDWRVEQVFKDGKLVARDGEAKFQVYPPSPGERIRNSIRLAPIDREALKLPAGRKYRVIELIPGQILTRHKIMELDIEDGQVKNEKRDIAKLAVIERHHATGNIGLGLLEGLGLKKGALAVSVAHDSHNIIVVGASDEDMLKGIEEIEKMGGGMVLVAEGDLVAGIPLPLAGLMSEKTMTEVAKDMEELNRKAMEMGIVLESPTMALSFLALPVIPELKLTDRGLFDSQKFQPVNLVVE